MDDDSAGLRSGGRVGVGREGGGGGVVSGLLTSFQRMLVLLVRLHTLSS